MKREAPVDFSARMRIYWEDTDAAGIVFYANYLKFFERARTEWLRSLGHEQESLRAQTGALFVVTDTNVRYLRPARLDDLLSVTVRLQHAGRAQMTIAQQAWRTVAIGDATLLETRKPALLAEGTIRIGCVDAGTFRPQRIPTAIVDSVRPMLTSNHAPG